jgi:hypothetical protein
MQRPTLQEQILALIEQYERERAAERARDMTLADRLDHTGHIRAQWKDIEAEVPDLIRAAADQGMDPREISERLRISHASGYVARILRQQRAQAAGDDGDPDTRCMTYHPDSDFKWSARCEMSHGHSTREHRGRDTNGTVREWLPATD